MIQKEKERKGKPANIYIIHWKAQSLGLDVLELPRLVKEVVGISLGHKPALIRLLHKVFVALLLSKGNGILLALELEVGALHSIGGRLPAHEGVLPPVTLLQNVPIHPPVVSVPGARLGSRLCGAVDSIKTEGLAIEFLARGAASRRGRKYLTVRAWRSVGAPERTAAGRVGPGSLPSITRLGTGENWLRGKGKPC